MGKTLTSAGLVLAICVAGCQPAKPPPRHVRVFTGGASEMSADQAVATDPCAMQMHDIEGTLLAYYAVNHQLPQQLDQLIPMADIDTPLNFVCPETHEPYVYVPAGLAAMGSPKHIILYDAVPHQDNKRWCILISPPNPGSGSLTMEVLPIPEGTFRRFLPGN